MGIGAGASVLGNISVGDGAKIGSGAIVLKPIPQGVTAVGSPARIIGWASEKRPGSTVDITMMNVDRVKSESSNNDSNEIIFVENEVANDDKSSTSAVTNNEESPEANINYFHLVSRPLRPPFRVS